MSSRRRGGRSAAAKALAVVLLVTIVLASGGVFDREPSGHFNTGQNAAWLEVGWVNDPHTDAEVEQLAARLERHEVRYVYVYVTYLKPSGQFNPTYAHAAAFTRRLKTAGPGLSVQAWIGLPLRSSGPFGSSGTVDLASGDTRQKIATFCAQIVRTGGFDGVHLDPEPAHDGDDSLLTLLDDVRGAIGSGATLSMASPRIRPILAEARLPSLDPAEWSAGYYRQVARRVNQLAVMTYDSALPLPALYRRWQRTQVRQITRALAGTGVQVFVGVPTSEERTITHWPAAENMGSGLAGVLDGLGASTAEPRVVAGVAIYPDWETDEREWAVYDTLWLGHPPPP